MTLFSYILTLPGHHFRIMIIHSCICVKGPGNFMPLTFSVLSLTGVHIFLVYVSHMNFLFKSLVTSGFNDRVVCSCHAFVLYFCRDYVFALRYGLDSVFRHGIVLAFHSSFEFSFLQYIVLVFCRGFGLASFQDIALVCCHGIVILGIL